MSDREAVLARKLAERFHLNVPERSELLGGTMRGSAFVAAVGEILVETGMFPRGWRPDRPFDGVIIESSDHGLVLHEQHEVGVMRYSGVASRMADSLESAVRAFVAGTFGDNIDGIGLAWEE
jgi:hypothetical protein